MKKLLMLLLAIMFLLLSCQRSGNGPYVVGILNHASVAEDSIRGFKDAMEEMGYIEGENISYIYSGPVPKEGLKDEAVALMEAGVDLILSITMPATMGAIEAGADKKVPILFAPNSNPVAAGIVKSMEKPGGNITGVSFWLQEGKRLEWLKRIVPGVKLVVVPYMKWDKSPQIDIEQLTSIATKLGITIVGKPISHPSQMEAVATDMPDGTGAVFIPADALIESNAPVFIEQAMKKGIPVSSPQSYGFSKGALFAYGFEQYDTGRQGAKLAALILKGTHPKEIPVEMAEIKLMINLKTAASLGIKIPPEITSKAEMVIR